MEQVVFFMESAEWAPLSFWPFKALHRDHLTFRKSTLTLREQSSHGSPTLTDRISSGLTFREPDFLPSFWPLFLGDRPPIQWQMPTHGFDKTPEEIIFGSEGLTNLKTGLGFAFLEGHKSAFDPRQLSRK